MNRHERRKAEAEAKARRDKFARTSADRAEMIRLFHTLVEQDPTISGATVLLPDGTREYFSADLLRQGSRA
jgi:hypothetical protein